MTGRYTDRSTESVERVGVASRYTGPTYVRTDGLTKNLQPSAEILGLRNARAHIRDLVVGEVR